MVLPRDEDADVPFPRRGQFDLGIGRQRDPQVFNKLNFVKDPRELGSHEEIVQGVLYKFTVADDVELVPVDDTGDAVDQTGTVGTLDEENG